jgi:hypothetical protein
MNREELKKQACLLREKGKTYCEIKSLLGVDISKSTLSYWCQGVKLPAWYDDKIKKLNDKNLNRALKIAWASNKNKRETFLKFVENESLKVVSSLDEANLKIILAALYLGEGAKWRGHSGLMLGSSDTDVVLLYLELLNKCYGIKPIELKCRISYRTDQNIKKLESFWSKITGVPPENFYKTKPDPRTLGKKTQNKEYKGVCVLTCKGTNIQLELEQIVKILINKLRARGAIG